jgi:hypothetical protein
MSKTQLKQKQQQQQDINLFTILIDALIQEHVMHASSILTLQVMLAN